MNNQRTATAAVDLRVPAEQESTFQNIIGIHLGACIPPSAQPISEFFTITDNANLEPEQAEPFIKGARTLDDSLADFDKAVDGLRQSVDSISSDLIVSTERMREIATDFQRMANAFIGLGDANHAALARIKSDQIVSEIVLQQIFQHK